MKLPSINILLYMAKCCAACVIAFFVSPYLDEGNSTWFFISTILVLSPDSKEAMTLAMMRIKANLMASVVCLALMLAGLPPMVGICIAFCVIILLCDWFNLMPASRSALAAVIIVLLHPYGHHHLALASERAIYVVGGCAVGLILTFIFHRTIFDKRSEKTTHVE